MKRIPIIEIVMLILTIFGTNAQENCKTPNNSNGICISIEECQPLWLSMQNAQRKRSETQFLMDSQCGQLGRLPKVCCSTSVNTTCMTPYLVPGKCVDIYECPSILEILKGKKPYTQVAEAFMKNSTCTGAAKVNVCCAYPKGDTVKTSSRLTVDPLLEMKGKCGMMEGSDRIFNGEETSIDDYPWMALIEYRTRANTVALKCAGSLINPRYVITAAHCLHGSIFTAVGIPTHVRLGEFDTRTEEDCVPIDGGMDCNEKPLSVPIEKIIIHENYDQTNSFVNDIALIRLAEDVRFTHFIKPVCLPTADITTEATDDLITLKVAGWGMTEKKVPSPRKLHLDVNYKTLQTCQNAYKTPPLLAKITERQICAGGVGGKDSCKGDSGGPLMLIKPTSTELVGMVSFGPKPCAMQGIPGVYSKVYYYLDWIKSNIIP